MTRMLQYLAANAPNTKDGIPSIYYFVNAGKKAPEGMRTAKERREFVLRILGELGDLLEWPVKPKEVNHLDGQAATSAARRVRPGTPLISAGPGSGSGDGSNHSWASGSGSGSQSSLSETQRRYLREHGRLPTGTNSSAIYRRKYANRPQRAQPDPHRAGRYLHVERPTLPTNYAHYFGAQSNEDIKLVGGRQPTGDLLEDWPYRERTPSPQRSLQSTDLALVQQEYRYLFQSRSPTPAEGTDDADAAAGALVLAQYGADRAVQQTLVRGSSIDAMLGVVHADLLAADDDAQWMPTDILPVADANQQFVDPLDVFGIDTNDGVEEGPQPVWRRTPTCTWILRRTSWTMAPPSARYPGSWRRSRRWNPITRQTSTLETRATTMRCCPRTPGRVASLPANDPRAGRQPVLCRRAR